MSPLTSRLSRQNAFDPRRRLSLSPISHKSFQVRGAFRHATGYREDAGQIVEFTTTRVGEGVFSPAEGKAGRGVGVPSFHRGSGYQRPPPRPPGQSWGGCGDVPGEVPRVRQAV